MKSSIRRPFRGCGSSLLNFLTLKLLPKMGKITEEMINECYEAFRIGNKDHVPHGMNQTSAKITMIWLDSLINTLKPYYRSGSLMLEKIRQDYGLERAKKQQSH